MWQLDLCHRCFQQSQTHVASITLEFILLGWNAGQAGYGELCSNRFWNVQISFVYTYQLRATHTSIFGQIYLYKVQLPIYRTSVLTRREKRETLRKTSLCLLFVEDDNGSLSVTSSAYPQYHWLEAQWTYTAVLQKTTAVALTGDQSVFTEPVRARVRVCDGNFICSWIFLAPTYLGLSVNAQQLLCLPRE